MRLQDTVSSLQASSDTATQQLAQERGRAYEMQAAAEHVKEQVGVDVGVLSCSVVMLCVW